MKAISLGNNEGKSVTMFLKKKIFFRFGTPRAIINNGGYHFCNKFLKRILAKYKRILEKYGFRHNVDTLCHPQTSRQVEVSDREIKKILSTAINANRIELSRILDDDLWSYRKIYKTP